MVYDSGAVYPHLCYVTIGNTMFKSTLAALLLLVSMQAGAALYSFDCITDNSGSCDGAASLLSLDISDAGDDTLFTFAVADGANLAVKSIYFDDEAALLDPNAVSFSYGGDLVSFQAFTDGGNLPSGNTIGFTSDYSSDATPPSGDDKNGIDNGEWLGITFLDTDFDSILTAISLGTLDIGMHIGSLEGGYSESVALSSISAVPVPAAFWLFGTGLIAFVGMGRRINV